MANSFNVMSVFCEVGGVLRGLSAVLRDFKTICYVEREAYKCEVLASQMEAGNLAPAPITPYLEEEYRKAYNARIHLLASTNPRTNWAHVNNCIRDIRPSWVFFACRWRSNKAWCAYAREELRGMGYKTREGLFSAIEVGASHSRKRLFILGKLAHAKRPRLQVPGWDEKYCERQEHLTEGLKQCCIIPSNIYGDVPQRLADAFPAWPGYGQYDWEAPRTLESGMGRADDGVSNRLVRPDDTIRNFRINCLGTEVVSQQVTLAFMKLMIKMEKDDESRRRK